jgi:hypothetical protein
MINFRRIWCKTAKKGSWWYNLLDCKRYEPAPQPPIPPVPPPPDPPPPTTPKTDYPYHKEFRALTYSGMMLTDLCTKDGPLFQESLLPAYYDRLATAGVSCVRSLLSCRDSTPGWQIWQETDPGYYDMLRRRLQMIKDRDLTAIVSLKPYAGDMPWDAYRKAIALCMEFMPNVIFEPANEPSAMDLPLQIAGILRNEFKVPDRHILFCYVDSSDFKAEMLRMGGLGLASCHRCGSTKTIFYPKPSPIGWAASDGTMELMRLGMTGSNDGDDAAQGCHGDVFYGLNPLAIRPTLQELYDCALWMLENGKGYEHLSAKAFLASEEPNLRALTEFCYDEAKILRSAEDATEAASVIRQIKMAGSLT